MINDPLRVLVDTVQKLQRRGFHRNVRKILQGTRPTDIAGLLRFVPDRDRQKIFKEIEDIETRATVLSEMDPEILESFLGGLLDEDLVLLLEEMSSDDTVDILEQVPEDRKHKLLRMMKREDMTEAEDLLQYDPETAGGIMVPDFFALTEETTCDQAVNQLRKASDQLEMAFYIYVINEHSHLVGVVSLRDLVISRSDRPVSEIMETDVIRVQTRDDQEVVAKLVARYNLLALPVVDETNKLVGIVTVDDVIDVLRSEATEDMFKMAGAGGSPITYDGTTIFKAAKSRLPWLFASWLGGVGVSFIIRGFQDRLIEAVVLASFMPIILGMGGNVGTQTLTIVTRGLALGQINFAQILKVLRREMLIGFASGVVYGTLLGFLASLMSVGVTDKSPVMIGVTVGVSLALAMMIATAMGSTVPLVLHRLHIDPAVATGPFVSTSVDALGTVVYFSIATVLLGL
jgi:magnesium transporter